MSIINEIISNIWFFQTESIVPIFKEFSFIIIILALIATVVPIALGATLGKSEKRIPIGLVLYPITIIGFYIFFLFFGNYLGFDFSQITISQIIDNAIKYWWVFFVFWPVVLLQLPFNFIGKMLGKKSEQMDFAIRRIIVPIYEEFVYRILAINTIFLLTNSIEITLFFSAIAFSIIHFPNRDDRGWSGPSEITGNIVMGMMWGVIAINYGLIFSIAAHIFLNLTSKVVGKHL